VLYGGEKNISFSVTESDFREIIYTPTVYIVNLDIEGEKHSALIKEMQFHPVTDKLLHADFYEAPEDRPVVVEIPVKFTGSSVGVREGGKLVTERRKIAVKGLTKDIPSEIDVDVTALAIGKSICAGEIATKKFDIVISKDTPIVSVRTTRAAAVVAVAEA
jgi:large subunit ribosomal protein L25